MGRASSLLKPMMVFGVLYSDLVGPSWRHLDWRTSQLERQCWLMLDSSWGHLEWCSIKLLSWRHVRWSAHMVLFLFGGVVGRHIWCIPFG